MGYYSSFEFQIKDAKVDTEKIKEIENYFENPENENVYGFYNVVFDIDKENYIRDIILEEYYAKFYDSEYFAEELSKALIEGKVKLHFTGEDGERWGFVITPNNVEDLNFVTMTNKEYVAFNRFKAYLKVLYELSKKANNEILVKTPNGSGACDLKLPQGTTAGQTKNMLKFLFNDLAHDLGIHKSTSDTSDYDSIFNS